MGDGVVATLLLAGVALIGSPFAYVAWMCSPVLGIVFSVVPAYCLVFGIAGVLAIVVYVLDRLFCR